MLKEEKLSCLRNESSYWLSKVEWYVLTLYTLNNQNWLSKFYICNHSHTHRHTLTNKYQRTRDENLRLKCGGNKRCPREVSWAGLEMARINDSYIVKCPLKLSRLDIMINVCWRFLMLAKFHLVALPSPDQRATRNIVSCKMNVLDHSFIQEWAFHHLIMFENVWYLSTITSFLSYGIHCEGDTQIQSKAATMDQCCPIQQM